MLRRGDRPGAVVSWVCHTAQPAPCSRAIRSFERSRGDQNVSFRIPQDTAKSPTPPDLQPHSPPPTPRATADTKRQRMTKQTAAPRLSLPLNLKTKTSVKVKSQIPVSPR